MPSTETKPALRAAALARRDRLAAGARNVGARAIVRSATELLAPLRFECLSGFLPIRSECDPGPIMKNAWSRGAAVALPAFLGPTSMVFRRYGEGDPLVPAGFGTREPAPEAPIVHPDVMLVPLAAFDRRGSRIGYGKGHYDRTIATMRAEGHWPLLIGLAFSVQEVDRIPVESHDVGLDWLVTERDVFDFRPRPS